MDKIVAPSAGGTGLGQGYFKLGPPVVKDSSRFHKSFAHWLAVVALLVALTTCTVEGIVLYICYSPVPWGDMWDFWAWSQKYGTHFITHLPAQHNEHRIAVARLFFLFDQYFCGGTAKSLAVFIPVIQLLHAVLLWRLATRVVGLARPVTLFLGSIALATAFASQQFTNFTWYFQIQFVAVYFGATLCCLSLMKVSSVSAHSDRISSRAKWWLAATIVSGVLTTYCMANGLLIWPILLFLAFFLRLAPLTKRTLAIAGALSWFAYFWDYQRPKDHTSPWMALTHLGEFCRFLITVVGSPFADTIAALTAGGTPDFIQSAAGFIGLAGLVWFLVLAVLTTRGRSSVGSAQLVYLHLLTFAAASMMLIASGRFNFPLTEALQSRYTTPSLLFWLFTVSLTLIRLETARNASAGSLFLRASCLTLFVFFIACNKPGRLTYDRGYRDYLRGAQTAMANRVFDQTMWARAGYWDTRKLIPLTNYLFQHHLSVYADSWQPALGAPLNNRFRLSSPAECTGYVDSVEPISGLQLPGLRVTGWVWDTRLHESLDHIVFTDQTGRIVGSAFGGAGRPDVVAHMHALSSPNVGWTGYAAGLDHSVVSAFMLLPDGQSVCAAGSHASVVLDAVPFTALGSSLPAAAVEIKGSWALNGFHPSLSAVPLPDRVYASWNGSDANTGTLSVRGIRAAGGSRFAIPLATGPTQNNLSIRVVDSDTQQVVASLSPLPYTPQWKAWLIRLPATKPEWNLTVIADDFGNDWGAWFAVGLPLIVR